MVQSGNKESVNKMVSRLWGLAFVLIIGLAVALALLFLPEAFQPGPRGMRLWNQEGYYLSIFLIGLSVLFCCYTVLKRKELRRLNEKVRQDERELEETQTRLSEILSLFKLATLLNVQLPAESILNLIVQRVVNAMKAQQASVMLYDSGTGILETKATYGLESEFTRNARCKFGESIAGSIVAGKKAVILDNAGGKELQKYFKIDRNITSALIIPLYFETRCIGVMNVNRINHPEPFKPYHCELGELFGTHVAKVIAGSEMVTLLDNCASQLENDLASVVWKLGDLDRMKDAFLSTASHELRTPLTSLIGNLAMLEQHGDSENRGALLSEAQRACGQLANLVGDIVKVSRVEDGEYALTRAETDLNALIHETVLGVLDGTPSEGVQFQENYARDLPSVYLDAAEVGKVLKQLLESTVRFSPKVGVIQVETSYKPGFVVLEIRDEGYRAMEGNTAELYSLFGQNLRESDRSVSGMGMGLYMVKRIIELHGGHVTALTGEASGITFGLHFPVRAEEGRVAA